MLSVVIPVYRVEAYLPDCLDSILSQAGPTVELIAVNDGSTDRSASILDQYARHEGRLQVVHLPTNSGPGQARNAGIDRCRGEYIWFVDADDWLPPGSVQAVCDRLVRSTPDVLIIDHAEVYENGSTVPFSSRAAGDAVTATISLADQPELLRLAHSACTKVVRRSFLEQAGLRFRPGWYEDSSFSHPLLMAARRIDVLHRICYCYRRRKPGGITTTVSCRHFEVFDQYQHLFEIVDQAAGAYDAYRPELFRLMINHYLVIVGNDWRLPAGMQRAFFRRVVEDYRRWAPAGGYPVPGGAMGLKHRLVRHDAYLAYASLRLAHRGLARVRRQLRLGPSRAAGTGSPTAVITPVPHQSAELATRADSISVLPRGHRAELSGSAEPSAGGTP